MAKLASSLLLVTILALALCQSAAAVMPWAAWVECGDSIPQNATYAFFVPTGFNGTALQLNETAHQLDGTWAGYGCMPDNFSGEVNINGTHRVHGIVPIVEVKRNNRTSACDCDAQIKIEATRHIPRSSECIME